MLLTQTSPIPSLDVVKSFDTVDHGFLDFVLSRPGLLGWFRQFYVECHAKVRGRFKLASELGQAGPRVALSMWNLQQREMYHGVSNLRPWTGSSRRDMRTTSSASPVIMMTG